MTSDAQTATLTNPLADGAPADPEDAILVARAHSGDRASLEELVRRHQRWIYNIAIRMLHHPQDAEDATQEILLKAVTRLSSFEDRSSFRTWLYRIAVNHLLNTKRGRVERESLTFREYGDGLDVSDTVGAELLQISRENFRQRLSRARRDLHSFMNDRCGLVNAANPCELGLASRRRSMPTACIAAMMILPHGRAGSGAKKLKAANHVSKGTHHETARQ